ncbi:MAG: DUF1570 domain-containing protein [Planctomycetes bacterium]|nr:DUF1570 domain-containing protein [Planctomycetota bacterium]
MPPLRRFAAVLLAGCLASPATAQADTRDRVLLVGGKELRGRVVRVDAEQVLLRVGSVDKPIARKLVAELHTVAASHRDLLRDWQAAAGEDPAALLRLATTADEARLPHEARLFRWLALLQRPDDDDLHATLGHRRSGDQWLVPFGDRRLPLAAADALSHSFANAWRLRSEHFDLRCAAGLRTGLETLLELEGLYHAFHAIYDDAVPLRELVEPIAVHLYHDREQMPGVSGRVGAYYQFDIATLFTFCERGRAHGLAHEAVHALLHHTFVRATKGKGQLPSWLDEGWADHLAGRVQQRVPGKTVLLDASVQPGHRQLLAATTATDRLGLHRVLNLQTSDFQTSSDQALKYAQAWALFQFLFEHPEAALRERFVGYLQEAVAGRGQASTFRKAFGTAEQALGAAFR